MRTVQEIVAQAWPDWRLENQIGAGAYGEVYRAVRQDVTGEAESAIKVIKIRRHDLRGLYPTEAEANAEFDRLMRRFSREIQMMRTLKGQTNVVSIEDYQILEDEENGCCYILIRMELLTPLLVDLDVNGWDEEKLIRIGIDLCRGLEACENEHIAHRDIKPENILLNHRGDFKLGDFGVARTLDATREAMTGWEFAQWEPFIAPEVKNGQLREADFREACRVDIYALGMLMYWIAGGQRFPFLADKQLHTSQDREEAERRRLKGESLPELTEISPALREVIRKACAFDSKRRYENARAFREALEQVRYGGGDTVLSAKLKKRGTGKSGKRAGVIAACAAIVIAVMLWVFQPIPIEIAYVNAAGDVLQTQTIEILPGTEKKITGDVTLLPEGYALADQNATQFSASLLRQVTPGNAEILCIEQIAEAEPETLEYTSIWYPHVYAIGQPLTLDGTVESPSELTSLTMNLYVSGGQYTQEAELASGTKRFEMKELPMEIFTHLDEGKFWLEIVAADAGGRVIGFSHTCSASYLAEEHTMYELNRAFAAPELRGSLVYEGHTYEVWRLAGGGWNMANAFAQGKGGHLVSFADDQEFSAVTSYCLGMGVKYANIGLQRTEDGWIWTDGSPLTFHPWKADVAAEDTAYPPVGSMLYTADQEWKFGKATQYEMAHFIVEYEDVLR